ncbi:MAG: type III-B CRISPR module-associated Cmr3 family protein [Bryobacteraceae bacterium]
MHYLLEPLDVALFRDGRPFSPGEMLRARPIGPVPMPRTVYGALRGLILQHNGISLNDFQHGKINSDLAGVLGTPERTGELRIRGPFLGISSEDVDRLLLPCPADFARIRRGTDWDWGFQRPSQGTLLGNYPGNLQPLVPHKYDTKTCRWIPCGPEDPVSYELEQAVLDSDGLRDYLTGTAIRTEKLADYLRSEPHVGIERSTETLRPETGKIYSVEFHRLAYRRPAAGGWRAESAAYVVEVLAPEDCLPQDTVFTVGGERRPFRIRRVQWPAWFDEGLRREVSRQLKSSCTDKVCWFRLYLLTPARFRGLEGWRPEFLDQPHRDLEFTLVAAAVPRAIPYSGWDMLRRQPRCGYRLAPAGSVYFLIAKAKSGMTADALVDCLVNRFWLESIAAEEDDRKMGFGLTLIGGWSYAG